VDQASSRRARRRMPGFWWLVAAAAVALLILGTTSSALATLSGNKLNQKLPISVDAVKYQGSDELCDGTPAGSAIWHFVLTKTTATSALLELTFAGAGTAQYPSDLRTGSTLHWYISTSSPETLTAASTNARGNRLNLSEICDGGPAIVPSEEPSPSFDLSTDTPTDAPTDQPTTEPTPTFGLDTAGPITP
jgi:hypothetical protein